MSLETEGRSAGTRRRWQPKLECPGARPARKPTGTRRAIAPVTTFSTQAYLLMRFATTLTDAATIATTTANDSSACDSTTRRILEEVTSVSDTWNVALTVTATYAKST